MNELPRVIQRLTKVHIYVNSVNIKQIITLTIKMSTSCLGRHLNQVVEYYADNFIIYGKVSCAVRKLDIHF